MLKKQLKDNIFTVLPIVTIVLLLNFTIAPLEGSLIYRFLIGSALVIIGLTFFLIGVDVGITPTGNKFGQTIAKTNKLIIVILASAIFGFFISVAEPALIIFAEQVEKVTNMAISSSLVLIVVSIGLGLLVAVGIVRVIYKGRLNRLLTVLYLFIFVLAIVSGPEFLAISFDASGATTGLLAVPFMLALSSGVASMNKDSALASADSFGLVATASAGAIISVLLYGIIARGVNFDTAVGDIGETIVSSGLIKPFLDITLSTLVQGVILIAPLFLIFVFLQIFSFKLPRRQFLKKVIGYSYSYIGLVIFLIGVNGGFMEVGRTLGNALSLFENSIIVVLIGFFIGVVTILAEPATHVLVQQIEDVTSGSVKRKSILIALSTGVGLAVALSVVRVLIPDIQLWHFLLPGYIVAISLSYIAPKLFVGIAFDAGGVATGPITTTFILAFMQGVASTGSGGLLESFGMIAIVALTPILTLQILGIMYKRKSKRMVEENA